MTDTQLMTTLVTSSSLPACLFQDSMSAFGAEVLGIPGNTPFIRTGYLPRYVGANFIESRAFPGRVRRGAGRIKFFISSFSDSLL